MKTQQSISGEAIGLVERPAPLAPLFAAYMLMMVLGLLLLRQGFAMPRGAEITFDRAVFMVINAATLTGFQLSVTPDDYLWPGQVTVLALTIGGSLFAMIVGSAAVVRIVGLPYSLRQVALAAVMLETTAILIGGVLLVRPGTGALAALMQSAAAVGNSGVHIGRLPDVMDWRAHVVLLPLAVMGGLGLAVLMNLWDWALRRRPLVTHSRVVLTASAGIYLAGTGLILLLEWMVVPEAARSGERAASELVAASAASLNARTLGMPFSWVAALARPAQWIIILLMIIGASPGGSGGGLKTTTLVALFGGARRLLNGQRPTRALGIALVWIGLYLLVVIVGLVVLLATQSAMETDRLLMLCVSAASNVGISHDTVTLVDGGLYTLACLMLLGRLTPLMILWWMATTSTEPDLAVG